MSVLATAENLVSRDAIPELNAPDAACLILAVLLHDVGMHLTQDGFCRLIRGESSLQPIARLGDRPWTDLWEEFRSEAVRFTAAQNTRLFGAPHPVLVPTPEDLNWTRKQEMLIGEFIRRYHPQLAHQIALHGFPGSTREQLGLELVDDVEKDVVGLIARSHGMDLRRCVDYLEEYHFNRIDPARVHASYLMCLLRVSDYLQIDADRSMMRLRLQSLRSPLSMLEHRKHLAIPQLTRDKDDDQAIRVIVRPESVETAEVYFAIAELLASIQQEVDGSWAILGELYGRQAERNLNRLGLTIRRIRSNIHDDAFRDRLPFVPVHLRFRSADSKLFALLVRPLYGS